MPDLSQLFSKYTGWLRAFRPVYFLNNWLNRDKLRHNKVLYEKYGIKKNIYGSISQKDLKQKAGDLPWLDQADALNQLRTHPDFSTFDPDTRKQLEQFVTDGYMVLSGFYSDEEIDQLNQEIDQLRKREVANFNYTGKKMMNVHKHSERMDKDFFRNEQLLRLLNFIMGKTVVPFQTIGFIQGSEQRAHSDSIHMTTEPQGYLVAAWTALEDLHLGNGPLFYYPGSHRLPFVSCQDYQSGNTRWMLGANNYKNYEDKIEALIEAQQLEKTYFLGKKGDVFIWHANLLHGGSAIRKEGSTRRSMVAHYFCEEVICYHEISQRPALIG